MKTAISGFLLLLLYSLAQSGVVPAPMEKEELRAYIDDLVKHFHDDPGATPAPLPSSRRKTYARPSGNKYSRPSNRRIEKQKDVAKTTSKPERTEPIKSESRKSRMLIATDVDAIESQGGADRKSRKLKKEIQDINTDLDAIDQAVSDMAGGEGGVAHTESVAVETQKLDDIKTDLAMIDDAMTDLIQIESGKDVEIGSERTEEIQQLGDIKSHLDDIVQAISPATLNASIEDIQKDIVDIEQAVSDIKQKSENIFILETMPDRRDDAGSEEQSEKPVSYLDQFLKKSLEIFQMGSMMTRTFMPGIFGAPRLPPAHTFDSKSVLDLMKPTSAPSRRSRKNATVISI